MKTWKRKKLKLRALVVAILSLLLFGCKSTRNTVPHVPAEVPIQKIEIITEKVVRDTFYSEPIKVQQTIGASRSRLENSWSVSTAHVDTLGVLTHTLENRPLLPGKLIKENTHRVDSVPAPYPVPYPVPGPERVVEIKRIDVIWYTGIVVIIAVSLAVVFGLIIIIRKLFKK